MNRPAPLVPNPIQAPGTSLQQWQGSRRLHSVPTITREALLEPGRRLVIVAPHPDDEVLMCGGLLASLASSPADLLLISVTDGEGSHPHSTLWPAARLRAVRPRESTEALARLGIDCRHLPWLRLGLADAQVAASETSLVRQLRDILRPGDQLLTTWRHDAHCDHEAVGRACAAAAQDCHAALLEVPVWAWHWASPEDPRLPWTRARKLPLAPHAIAAKRRAIEAHASQLAADPSTGATAILPPAVLERLLQPFELFFR
ncbi:PIG-L family deacetylase [Pseudomonas gingeri]|nr:PIG-L family deacetylase [Pseudomonas gingeri]NWA05768.1 PIG-L family deacetylase [Pseudomonas gingeri]